MTQTGLEKMEHNIARCRVVLSIAATLVVYIDPEEPLLARWIPIVTGSYQMDWRLFMVMATHVTYSLVVYRMIDRFPSARLVTLTAWVDVVFGVVIGTMTGGGTGPAYPFFAFAVVTSGLRGGLRQTMTVTTVSLTLYICLIVLSRRGGADVYIMRPVYLGITGYVVGYLGQQRLEMQEQMRQLEVAEQRHHIARELHDGYAQALAGINLRLEGSRRLLHAGETAEALGELTELQESVKREFDDLRRYARSLAGVEPTPTTGQEASPAALRFTADLTGPVDRIEHVLGIAREAITNVRRHAGARRAAIDIRTDASAVRIEIEDDGVGFPNDVTPWSIASRVREMGGQLRIVTDRPPGAHLLISLPQV